MGAQVQNYCDSCGDDVVSGDLVDAVQINALGSNGHPVRILLCTKPIPANPAHDENNRPIPPKVSGCARKVLSKAILTKLYEEVAEYVGTEDVKPFQL